MRHLAMILLALIAGCGTTINPNDLRLGVTSPLRGACRDYDLSDAEIEAFLMAGELDRRNGMTWAEQRVAGGFVCRSDACLRCYNAVIDQVYGVY